MGIFGDKNNKLDLTKSKLALEGTPQQKKEWKKKVNDSLASVRPEQLSRRKALQKRYDLYVGNHNKYTNITGKLKSRKKGHNTAIFNYAGKTVTKIAYSLANNPPATTIPARKVPEDNRKVERLRSQAVEDFMKETFDTNRFWLGEYRPACFNQVSAGDAAIKIYPINVGTEEDEEWEIRMVNHTQMAKIMVGWTGDSKGSFDFVIVEENRSLQSIEREFGIKVPMELALKKQDEIKKTEGANHQTGKAWGDKGLDNSATDLPTGETNVPSIKVIEYDDENVYALMISGELVSLAFKDGVTYPKMGFWVIVPNIPIPNSPWSMSDIDFMEAPQIEFNEASNEERDYIRVGASQKFVAYNMNEFDPESVKTGSGQVIFIDSPDGTSKFEPLATNVNVFPVDTYLNRVQNVMYDMGIPKVTFGAGGADSGRSKAMDYQSLVDLTIYKRDSWALGLDKLIEKVQILGNFYFKADFFKDPVTDQFVIRHAAFDWDDILPITQGDKVVSVLNKVTMGLPFRRAWAELGYRDVDTIIEEMREEAKDEDLMIFRSKMWALTGGLLGAQQKAQQVQQGMEEQPPAGANVNKGTTGNPEVNTPTPTLTSSQNQGRENKLPVSTRGGTTSFSSAAGFIAKTRQNLQAQGK